MPPGAAHPHLMAPMRGRDPAEPGRAATPLELFFDLVVVVAIAFAAERLHHAYLSGFGVDSFVSYALVFFGVWWAWSNFTWFASAYDTDDVVYRLGVLVIMTGALVLAAGVPLVFDERDFTLSVIGYVIMRIALVALWIRVWREDPLRRETARRYAIGVTLCQVGWLLLILVYPVWPLAWVLLVPAELLVPEWAERAERTTFHPEHIAERYGLFMIIVLGESVLAASLAIQAVINGAGLRIELLSVIVGGLLILYSTWWIYFDRPEEHLLQSLRTARVWTYLHLVIFAAVAAVGAGLVLAIEEASGHAHVGSVIVGAVIGVPLIFYLLSLWLLYLRIPAAMSHRWLLPAVCVLILGAIFLPMPVLVIGLIIAGMLVWKVWLRVRSHSATATEFVAESSRP